MELNSENLYRYQNGFMTIQETLDFEELLENNPDFQARIEQVEDPVFKHLAENRAFIDELLEAKAKPVNLFPKVFAIAASVMFGIWLFGNLIQSSDRRENLSSIAMAYGEQRGYASVDSLLKEDTLCDCDKNLRIQFKENQKVFLETLKNWKPKDNNQSQCKDYWLGWTLFELKAFDEAKKHFEKIYQTHQHSILKQRAMIGYMKVLIYTKDDDKLTEVAASLLKEPVLSGEAYDLALAIQNEFK